MKLVFILLYFSLYCLASNDNWQSRWWGVQRIVDNHQFYKNNQIIQEPIGSVQTLMGLVYYSKDFKVYKDCLNFEIPAKGEMGSIFVVTTSLQTPCEEVNVNGKRDGNILAKSLSFNLHQGKLILQITDEKFRTKELAFSFPHLARPERSEAFQSSVQRQYGRAVMILADLKQKVDQPLLMGERESDWHKKDLISCQTVNDECEKSISTCERCRFGYFEVLNGCPGGGPKFCGVDQCGRKGQPACRRGFLYQNGELTKMDCREDSSFGFCQKGLRVRCQGSLAICD